MKTIDYTIPITNEYTLNGYLSQNYDVKQLLFFDIETTGFIAKHTTLYLIGVLWYQDNHIYIRQWFNEDGKSEQEILTAFTTFCRDFSHLVHFNGLGFDIPYLKQKAQACDVSFDIDQTLSQIDIYKEIRSYKELFALDNMKQISIEQFLGISRDDEYNGKELIQVYQRYVAKHDAELEHLLLLHNHDDLLGMTKISQIMNYKSFMEAPFIDNIELAIKEDRLILQFKISQNAPLSKRITATKNGIHLNAIEQKGTLSIPIIHDTLQHYFKDYKNYYYLPLEDIVIHKNVANYVDAQNKTKATKENCYAKQTTSFIPFFMDGEYTTFQRCYNDKQQFITLDTLLLASSEEQAAYIKNTLSIFL